MRSSDIAALAGVTPRALRHYHQIGLLPEPARQPNGYRHYGVTDLVRLLRIKGLAAAGIALGDMPSFLQGRGASTDELLEALDKQLVGQINRLEEQRQLVARLKSDPSASGAGLGLVHAFGMLTDGRTESATETWREQLTLFSHLLRSEDLEKLYQIYDRMAHRSEEFAAFGKKLDALGPTSDDKEVANLAKTYLEHFGDILTEFKLLFSGYEKTGTMNLIYAHTMSHINESQRKFLSAVESNIKI